MKKSKKEFKPSYIVNLDNIKCLEDIPVEWGLAKHEAGLPISDDELISIINRVVDEVTPRVAIFDFCPCTECKCKKTPWYKRFWNWLTRKK